MTGALLRTYVVKRIGFAVLMLLGVSMSGLSYLGLGAQPPLPSWGNMLVEGRQHLASAWWIATFPGLAIFTTVLGFNVFGDGQRDALDPTLRGSS